jgi:hypothetical protein
LRRFSSQTSTLPKTNEKSVTDMYAWRTHTGRSLVTAIGAMERNDDAEKPNNIAFGGASSSKSTIYTYLVPKL